MKIKDFPYNQYIFTYCMIEKRPYKWYWFPSFNPMDRKDGIFKGMRIYWLWFTFEFNNLADYYLNKDKQNKGDI